MHMNRGSEEDGRSPLTQADNPRRDLTRVGFYISVAYLIFLTIMAILASGKLFSMSPNEFGDTLAGCFAPLAFLWLVLGFFQQGKELQASVRALEIQGEELQNSVKQQRELVKVSREHLESEIAANRQTLENFKNSERGTLVASAPSGFRLGNGQISVRCHVKNHGKNKVRIIEAVGIWQKNITKTDDLPKRLSRHVWVDADNYTSISFPVASDEERGDKKEVIGRIRYRDQFGDEHVCWVAGLLIELRKPDDLERLTGGNLTHVFQDMTDALADD